LLGAAVKVADLWCHVRPGRRVVSIYARQSQPNIRNHKSRNADRDTSAIAA